MACLAVALQLAAGMTSVHGGGRLPDDVELFIERREACDHFREEPWPEGVTPWEQERRDFLAMQMENYCKGTDAMLDELRKRYRDDDELLRQLERFETSVEVK